MSVIRNVFLCSWDSEWSVEEMENEFQTGKMKGGSTKLQYWKTVKSKDIFLMYHPKPQIINYILLAKGNSKIDPSYKPECSWTIELENGVKLRDPITIDDLRIIDSRPMSLIRRLTARNWNLLRKEHAEISGPKWEI